MPTDRSFLIFAFFLLAAVAFGLSALEPAHGELCEYSEGGKDRQCPTYDFSRYYLFRFFVWLQSHNGVLTAVATGFIAAFTIILARLAREQHHTTKILQRAFLALLGWKFLSHTAPDDKVWWSMDFTWKNSGVSPAIHARFYTDRYLEDVEMPENFQFRIGTTNEIFVGPQATIGTGNIGVTAEDLIAVRERRKFLYFWGRVDYSDIFENTPRHITKFAFQVLDFRGDVSKEWNANTNIVELITRHLNRHNCADQSCPPD